MSRATQRPNIYLDNAAATPISSLVKKETIKTMGLYGNPASFNNTGREARKRLDESRLTIARFLGSRPEEIIFTSSGSEANNLVLFGLAEAYHNKKEIISSPIEHPSVLNSLKVLKGRGFKIKFLKVDREGLIDLEDLKNKITDKTLLVSIMYANNEIGTIQPIKKIAKIIKDFRNLKPKAYNLTPFFHTDACQ